MKNIIIIGATSAIAEATARLFAREKNRLFLLARNQERLKDMTDDLRIRGATFVNYAAFDAGDFANHMHMIDLAVAKLGGIDVLLVAHGSLGDQKACERDFRNALVEMQTNLLSVISILTHAANIFEAKSSGDIAVIGSVAGDRGRQSNYIYGTAKGGLDIFLQGLRNRLYKKGVHVLTVKPGFVDTPMTAAFKKGFLWASPDRVARDIFEAIERKTDIIYTPFFWRSIMIIIKAVPEGIFKRLNL